jgi:hypothetical protein
MTSVVAALREEEGSELPLWIKFKGLKESDGFPGLLGSSVESSPSRGLVFIPKAMSEATAFIVI